MKPFVLVICDGFGEIPISEGNAIAEAKTPNLDVIRERWPHTTVEASGEAVGLPAGQQGNSEVGHLTIGSGRIVLQPLSRQHHEITTGNFYKNEVLTAAMETAKQRGTRLHIMGLVSPGGVHSHTDSAIATAKMARELGVGKVYVHAFTDGRDTPPTSAKAHIEETEQELAKHGAKIASVSGRYYAMDRDNRWDRIEHTYKMLTHDEHDTHHNATDYIHKKYQAGEHDEFLKPISIATTPEDRVRLEDGDVVIFFNFRPDRARQLTKALVDADFQEFERGRVVKDLHVVTFAEYDRSLDVPIAFPKEDIQDTLAETVSKAGLKQFHVAETEKYAHVTYFLNGGREEPFKNEDRKLIPSPKVPFYDQAPEMSAQAVADEVIKQIETGHHDLIAVNFANADMIGHTGNFEAAVKAIEVLDGCLGHVVDAAVKAGGAVLITADHGNAEIMFEGGENKPVTSHSTSPVPVILCGTDAASLRSEGGLQDIAPTVLDIMGLEKPSVMTGISLLG